MPTFHRSKRRLSTLNKRAVAAISTLLAALSPTPLFAGGVYSPFNVAFPNGVAQPSRSGPVALVDRFDAPDAWPEIKNYRDALSIEVGAEFDGAPALVVARKTTNPNDPEDGDTAWNATSVRRPLPDGAPGGEFVVRVAAKASKTALAGNDDATWKGCAVLWFDGDGEPCGETPFLFAAGVGDFFGSRAFSGRVPDAAASFAIRLGFDSPDLALGDWVAIRSVEFETPVDAAAPFRRSGEFISEIFPGAGSQVSWDADLPAGTAVRFQIATAPALPDVPQTAETSQDAETAQTSDVSQPNQPPQLPHIPGDFGEFVGPDGTAATFFDAPFAVDAPFFRYKATLVPNADGSSAPTLRSVAIGDRVDARFRVGGDDQAPKVSVVGQFAAPSRDGSAAVEIQLDDASPLRWSTFKLAVDETEIADFARSARINVVRRQIDNFVRRGRPNRSARVVDFRPKFRRTQVDALQDSRFRPVPVIGINDRFPLASRFCPKRSPPNAVAPEANDVPRFERRLVEPFKRSPSGFGRLPVVRVVSARRVEKILGRKRDVSADADAAKIVLTVKTQPDATDGERQRDRRSTAPTAADVSSSKRNFRHFFPRPNFFFVFPAVFSAYFRYSNCFAGPKFQNLLDKASSIP